MQPSPVRLVRAGTLQEHATGCSLEGNLWFVSDWWTQPRRPAAAPVFFVVVDCFVCVCVCFFFGGGALNNTITKQMFFSPPWSLEV